MKIGITAASGKLGGAIVRQLLQEIGKESIVAIARTPKNALHLGVETRKGDYNNIPELENALKGIDTLLLVSGMDEPQKRITQHRNVIAAAKKNGVKKIVFTSIIGDVNKTSFAPIVESNRQTESDLKNGGVDWVIGRNSLYLEPDLEYINQYETTGFIQNSAGDGLCGYTSRDELAYAYVKMLLGYTHNGRTYNLIGEPITQSQLATKINTVFGTKLTYKAVEIDAYTTSRKEELGDFLGTIIGSIYESIKNDVFNASSDFEKAAGRPHKTAMQLMKLFKENGK
ncbi:MAG: NAD(P)H dehydrogenase (quinone) [Crocinitomix sp.]|jgi:NAD(P)H dehydrogenase (quinone)